MVNDLLIVAYTRNGMVRLAYNPNFDQMKGPYLEALPEKLEAFQG